MRVDCTVKLTDKQKAAVETIKQGATHTLGYGGSRSGKTFLICFLIFYRAIRYPKSRHLICRLHANHAKVSLWLDTMRTVAACFKGVAFKWNETDKYILLPNGSEIWIDGLDDKERVDKILGREYATIYFNEASQIGYGTIQTVLTRLAQRVEGLEPRAFYDLNPTSKGHWTYKEFVKKIDPLTDLPLTNPDSYKWFQINPTDNRANIAQGYIETILAGMSESKRKRFLHGEYADDSELVVYQITDDNRYNKSDFDEWVNKVDKSNVRFTSGLDLGFDDADGFVVIAFSIVDNRRWLIYEHKARRQGIQELATAIRAGLDYVSQMGFPNSDIQIYSDTGGGGKKSVYDLAIVYGLPCVPAYKSDKESAIELLQDDIKSGRFMVPFDGAFDREAEKIVFQLADDGESVIRRIDDKTYHPDIMDSILYAMRYVWYYFSSNT